VDYGPVVFPSHIGKVFHIKIVCLVLVVFGYIFSAYILLYFIVSYRFTQRGSFVYWCFSQQIFAQTVSKKQIDASTVWIFVLLVCLSFGRFSCIFVFCFLFFGF
jgi:hypothetical protein